jgi:hypothetical protein
LGESLDLFPLRRYALPLVNHPVGGPARQVVPDKNIEYKKQFA